LATVLAGVKKVHFRKRQKVLNENCNQDEVVKEVSIRLAQMQMICKDTDLLHGTLTMSNGMVLINGPRFIWSSFQQGLEVNC
jgi:fructosamine-3-kinase